MPLKPMPPDPEPTDQELQPYLGDQFVLRLPVRLRRHFAAFRWQLDKRTENPNLFLVPYAHQVQGYPSYLETSKWSRVRKRVLEAANHKCRACNAKATQVHHRDYRPRVLAGEDTDALIALCRSCHERIEAVKRGRSWNEAEWLLSDLVRQKEKLAQP